MTKTPMPSCLAAKIVLARNGGIQAKKWHKPPISPPSMRRIQRFLQQSYHEERREGDRIFYVSWLEVK